MYFPVGWPKILSQQKGNVETNSVFCNRDRSLFGVLTDDSVDVWYCKVNISSFLMTYLFFLYFDTY